MVDVVPFVVTVLAFGAVAAVVFVVGQHYAASVQIERRLPAAAASRSDIGGGAPPRPPPPRPPDFQATGIWLRSRGGGRVRPPPHPRRSFRSSARAEYLFPSI